MPEDKDKQNSEDSKAKEAPQEQETRPDSAAETVQLTKAEHEALLKQIEELSAKKDQMLRTAAEFENAKKRLEREKSEFIKFNQESFIKELLPIVDNFERALSHTSELEDKKAKSIITGIEMVLKQLQDILKRQGLTRVETVGKKFDPHLHEALAHVEEEGEDEIITDEIESGYMLHDRLIRAAKVRVRKAPENKEAQKES